MSASKDRKIREMHAEIEKLTAERDAYKADAERYRWLRQMSDTMAVSIKVNGNGSEISETLDAAIDAARTQAQKVGVGHNLAKCNETLRAAGKVYPRTCAECGLGPCQAQKGE